MSRRYAPGPAKPWSVRDYETALKRFARSLDQDALKVESRGLRTFAAELRILARRTRRLLEVLEP